MTLLKKDSNLTFLKEADSQALNQAIVDLGVAYDRFFKKISDRPKFKKKSNNQSYTTFVTSKNGSQLLIQGNKINIPKVGWIKIKQHRPVEGRITSGTITKLAQENTSSLYIVLIVLLSPLTKLIAK